MMKGVAAAVSLALLASGAQAQSPEELSERCGKQAAERFAKEWGSAGTKTADGRTTVSKYESHYNSRLNKCLYLEVRDSSQSGKAPLRMMDLLDLPENKTIGSYRKIAGDTFLVCLVCKTSDATAKRHGGL